MNDALTWAMAYILRDQLDAGAIDLSKVDESKRQAIGVMLEVIKKSIAEAEDDLNGDT